MSAGAPAPAPTEAPKVWVYYGTITRIHDGDTFTCDLDMGCYMWRHGIDVRVKGINAPELATDAGKAALQYTLTLLHVGQVVRLESVDGKFYEKYGRLLARVYYVDGAGAEHNFGDAMVAAQQAVPYLV